MVGTAVLGLGWDREGEVASNHVCAAGLSDVEKRYRQRYVDMIVTPGVTDTFRKRARIVSTIRSMLEAQGFLEVEA